MGSKFAQAGIDGWNHGANCNAPIAWQITNNNTGAANADLCFDEPIFCIELHHFCNSGNRT